MRHAAHRPRRAQVETGGDPRQNRPVQTDHLALCNCLVRRARNDTNPSAALWLQERARDRYAAFPGDEENATKMARQRSSVPDGGVCVRTHFAAFELESELNKGIHWP